MDKKKEKSYMLKALKYSNIMALKANKKYYIFLIILSLILCINTFIDLAFTEYIINSAYNLFAGKTNLKSVTFGILGFMLITLIFTGVGIV